MFRTEGNKFPCGLHMTHSQIKLVELEVSPSITKVTSRSVSVDLKLGDIVNGKLVNEASVMDSLEKLVVAAGTRGSDVHLSVPLQNTFLRKMSIPVVKSKEIRNLIDVELNGELYLPFQDPLFDFTSLTEKKDKLMVFITSQEAVNQLVRLVKEVGLNPVSAEISPLALNRILYFLTRSGKFQAPEKFMLIHVEKAEADVCFFEQGIPIFMRSVQIAGQVLGDSLDEVVPPQQYAQALSIELGRILSYYQHSLMSSGDEIPSICLSGNIQTVQWVEEYLRKAFEGKIFMPPFASILQPKVQLPDDYWVPIGLALRGA